MIQPSIEAPAAPPVEELSIPQRIRRFPRALKVEDLKEILGCSGQTIRNMILKGLPAFRMGRVWYFDPIKTGAWFEKRIGKV